MKNFLRKLFSVGLAVLTVCSVFPFVKITFSAKAAEEEVFSYNVLSTNEIVITGCSSEAKGEVVIPDKIEGYPVTTIASYAFKNLAEVTNIVIPETVISIGDSAFINSAITDIVIPSEVTVISGYTFKNCVSLKNIILPEGLQEIRSSAFDGCISLTEIDIPDTVTSMGQSVFCKSGIESVTIPPKMTAVPNYCFRYCESLKTVILPEGLTKIGDYAFEGCVSLSDVNIPDNVSQIGKYAFSDTAITSIAIPDGITIIPDYTFFDCASLERIDIPETVTEIGIMCFQYCSSLKYIELPKNLTKLGKQAFLDCKGITSMHLPSGITEIGYGTFWGCTGLTDMVIPDSVLSLGRAVFLGSGVTSVEISSNVTVLPSQTFFRCTELTTVALPDSLVEIEESAFNQCSALKEVDLPETVTKIGNSVFSDCTSLERIELPEVLTELGESVFNGCTNLACDMVIPRGITALKSNLFHNCYKLENIILHDNITFIGGSVFFNTKYSPVILPDSVQTLDYHAFSWTTIQLPLPQNLEVIEEEAFYASSFVDSSGKTATHLEIPLKVKTIGANAFTTVRTTIATVNIPESVEDIHVNAFAFPTFTVDKNNLYYCNDEKGALYNKEMTTIIRCPAVPKLTEFTLPETVEVIEANAFARNSYITDIYISSNVKEIKFSAFSASTKLTDVYYSGTQEDWEAIAFGEGNEPLLNATIHYNYGKQSGTLGENIIWSFNEETKALSINGSGEMLSLASAEEYGWHFFKDEIETVEFSNSITSVGDNAFSGYPNLKEVYLGQTVNKIGVNSFTDCPSLAIVTAYALNFTAEENSFGNNDERFVFLHNSADAKAAEYAAGKGLRTIPINYDYKQKVMNFKDELTVYPDLPYLFLSKLVKTNPGMEYLYFEKLVFHGVEPETFDIEGLGNDEQAQYLTFNNLYLSLKKVKDGSAEGVKFSDFLTLLENGDYDSFMFELKSDEGKQQLTFKELWEKVTDHFVSSALRITSKIINFFRKIFK